MPHTAALTWRLETARNTLRVLRSDGVEIMEIADVVDWPAALAMAARAGNAAIR